MKTPIEIPLHFIMGHRAWLREFDGKTHDLLSGGRGFAGFKEKTFPPFADPEKPHELEIRARAIWSNYRALMDVTGPCYGTVDGPGVGYDAPEMIAGREYMALTVQGVTVMLQIPSHFDTARPFLIAAPSSGSRGVYGGMGVVGEWALKRGFAVVYTDKGTGTGYHILDEDRVILMNGQVETAENAGEYTSFDAFAGFGGQRENILAAHSSLYPHRIAVKHAHSGMNLQKNWGRDVLQAIVFGRTVLETVFPETGRNLKVIAAGISNGGLASIMAREMDSGNLIDGVAVSEPNVTPRYSGDFSLVQGDGPPFKAHSKSLGDYITLFNIFQPCASLSPEMAKAPFRFDAFGMSRAMCEQRCLSLKGKGLLKGESLEELAAHALSILRSYGTITAQEILLPSHYSLDVARSIAVTYISQYGCARVTDHLAGYSFAAVDKNSRPRALSKAEQASLFSDQSGIPPFGLVKLINDRDPRGPWEDRRSISPSTGRMDMNLDGALKLRALVTGFDETMKSLECEELDLHRVIQKNMEAIKVCGDLKGCPSIIVTGRSDAVLPVNHTSRPFLACNLMIEKSNSRLRYYEVTSAHHVDALNMLYRDTETCREPVDFAPLHVAYIKALDLMVDHLEQGRPLPPSQVVRPVAPYHTMPDIAPVPLESDRIVFKDKTLFIPE